MENKIITAEENESTKTVQQIILQSQDDSKPSKPKMMNVSNLPAIAYLHAANLSG